MKTTAVKSPALCSGLLTATVSLGVTCLAQSQGQELQPMGMTHVSASEVGSEVAGSGEIESNLERWEFTKARQQIHWVGAPAGSSHGIAFNWDIGTPR